MLNNTDYSMLKIVVFLQSLYEETNNCSVFIYCELKYWKKLISHSNYAETVPIPLNLGYYTIIKILLGVIPKICKIL